MKVIVLFVCALACASSAKVPKLDGRIVGGDPVEIEDFPYQLSLRSYGSHICGASIIASNWALTASHCVDGSYPDEMTLRAGSSYRATGGSIHQAEEIFMHPKFDMGTMDYDYALIKVSEPFPIGDAGVAAIALSTGDPAEGTDSVVSGWGTLESGDMSLPKQLQAVRVPIVNRNDCQTAYIDLEITERMVCAGYTEGGKDACQGDSGGPLVANGKQIGVVSWGYGCAAPDYPGVYSNVAEGRDWIKEVSGA